MLNLSLKLFYKSKVPKAVHIKTRVAQKLSNKSPKRTKLPAEPKRGFKPHHAKAYRKRHLSLAAIFILGSALTLALIIYIALGNSSLAESARKTLSESFQPKTEQQQAQSYLIKSSYGFSLSYNPQELSAGALVSQKIYVGEDLKKEQAYDSIRISQSPSSAQASISPHLNLDYYPNSNDNFKDNLQAAQNILVAKQNPAFKLRATNNEQLAGQNFLITDWELKESSDQTIASLQASFRSYLTFYQNKPLLITVNNGLSVDVNHALDKVARSIKFGQSSPLTTSSVRSSTQSPQSRKSLLDRLTFTAEVSAANQLDSPNSAEKASMLYSPAVVRIYNFFCMDITKDSQAYLSNICQASAGSGFFVGADGYIATNGHVAVNEPTDLVILHALESYANGDSTYLEDLIKLSGLQETDLIGAKTDQEKNNIIFRALYAIPKSHFQATNSTSNLLASLNEKQPDLEELQSLTEARKSYPETDSIKKLQLKAFDYRAIDGIYTGQFKTSDVALLKLSGQDYPSVRIGNIQSLSQGGDISILGYPGAASSNGLVSLEENKPTLTSGKVSAIKNAVGGKNQLIETDATIGHGNSGGPAFDNNAEVIGIATYTVDGAGSGDGTFNYIRDIADLSNLATNSSIDITQTSKVQTAWQSGVALFYQGHYSKAIKSFQLVKSLYPQHPRADQLIDLAQSRIDSGQEARDLPWLLIILASLFVTGTVTTISLAILHHRKHLAYLNSLQLKQNTFTPLPQNPNQIPPL